MPKTNINFHRVKILDNSMYAFREIARINPQYETTDTHMDVVQYSTDGKSWSVNPDLELALEYSIPSQYNDSELDTYNYVDYVSDMSKSNTYGIFLSTDLGQFFGTYDDLTLDPVALNSVSYDDLKFDMNKIVTADNQVFFIQTNENIYKTENFYKFDAFKLVSSYYKRYYDQYHSSDNPSIKYMYFLPDNTLAAVYKMQEYGRFVAVLYDLETYSSINELQLNDILGEYRCQFGIQVQKIQDDYFMVLDIRTSNYSLIDNEFNVVRTGTIVEDNNSLMSSIMYNESSNTIVAAIKILPEGDTYSSEITYFITSNDLGQTWTQQTDINLTNVFYDTNFPMICLNGVYFIVSNNQKYLVSENLTDWTVTDHLTYQLPIVVDNVFYCTIYDNDDGYVLGASENGIVWNSVGMQLSNYGSPQIYALNNNEIALTVGDVWGKTSNFSDFTQFPDQSQQYQFPYCNINGQNFNFSDYKETFFADRNFILYATGIPRG